VDAGLFRQLADGGLRHVFIGIESGVQRVLDTFGKRTTVEQNRRAIEVVRSLGLSLATGFIMFDPFTTTAELRENAQFLQDTRTGSYKAVANRVRVYSGTPLHSALVRAGRLRSNGLVHEFEFAHEDVARAYRLVVTCLKPIDELDNQCRRLEFRLDNAPADKPVIRRLSARLDRIGHAANVQLSVSLRDITSHVEQHPGEGPHGESEFSRDLCDRVAAEVATHLDELRDLHREFERG
jgi:radical SAM superfamily enzyme YgiQ (UPF0313 family)